MAQEVLMPKLGLTMTKGRIIKWLKAEGDAVTAGEPLLEIETEKLTNTVECPADGVLLKQVAQEGETWPISEVIGYVGQVGEAIPTGSETAPPPVPEAAAPVAQMPASAAAAQSAASPGGRVPISPLARKMAADMGVNTAGIAGSGPGGRIVKADILARAGQSAPAVTASAPVQADALGLKVAETLPYSGMRRAIGENMWNSWNIAPHVTNHVMVDVGELLTFREMINNGAEDSTGRVSVTDLLIKLVANALGQMPIVNSSLQGEEILCYETVNISLAVALENGLVVPVIRNANQKSLMTVSREAKELVSRARGGSLSPDDFAGGTFTISNLGGYGSVDFFTPIINQPEAAILGVGRTVDTVVAIEGEAVVRPMMGLSLSYNHRIIDGATAADFMKLVIRLLENPARAVSA